MKRIITALILSSLSLWGQSVTVSTSSTIQDTTGAAATSGYVEFDLTPSGPFYRVVGTGVLVTNVNRCGIDATGHVKNTTLSGSCLVWGTDIIQPANACYDIIFAPGTGSPYVVSSVSIVGSSVDLSNPTFCPTVKLVPDYVTITTAAQNGNIMPSASHVFSIGSSGFRYAQGWFDTINMVNLSATNLFVNTLSSNTTFTGINTFSAVNTFTAVPVFTLGISGTVGQTLGLPIITDTLLGRLTTDTLQNKTFDTANNTFKIAGATVSSQTGAGSSIVFAISPTLVTPILGVATGTSLALGGGSALTSTNATGTGLIVKDGAPNITSPQIFVGVANNGSGLKHNRGTTGCTTAAAAGATCTTVITWGTAFADNQYTPHCSGVGIGAGVPVYGGITAVIGASVTFQTVAATAAAAQFAAIDCLAIHD